MRKTAVLGACAISWALGCGGASTSTETSAPTSDASSASPTAPTTDPKPSESPTCVEDCVKSRQMQAISSDQIRKNCEEDCGKKE